MDLKNELDPRVLELDLPDELPDPQFLEVRTGLTAGGVATGEVRPLVLDAHE
jgi:hypothetical protein